MATPPVTPSPDSGNSTAASAASVNKSSASWTPQLRLSFLHACQDEFRKGNATSTGFKNVAWTAITKKFNEVARVSYNKAQLSSEYSQQRKLYVAFEKLKGQSGFGYDSVSGTVTASSAVWDAYTAVPAHKVAKQFRTAGLLNAAILEELFCGRVATGLFATGSNDPHSAEHEVDENGESVEPDEVLRGRNSARVLPGPPKKRSRNQGIIDSIGQLTTAMAKPKPLEQALQHFNGEVGASLPFRDKLKISQQIQMAGNAELYMSLSNEDRQNWVNDLLDYEL